MIRLIATDMDGTLLNAAHEVSNENYEAIKYAQSKGITVVIATGRAFYEANGPIEKTDLSLPYICLNGAEVRDEEFNIVHTSKLTRPLINKITGVLKKEDIYYQVYTNFGIYTEDPEKDLEIYVDIAEKAGQKADIKKIRANIQSRIDNGTLKTVDSYDEIENRPGEIILKILAFSSDLSKIDRAKSEISESQSLAVSSSSRGNIEITHSDAQKGIALEEIADQLNIPMSDVMAIGDNLNDVSMLEKAGYAVAMENGAPEVKEMADYITDSNEHSGVGNAIIHALKDYNR